TAAKIRSPFADRLKIHRISVCMRSSPGAVFPACWGATSARTIASPRPERSSMECDQVHRTAVALPPRSDPQHPGEQARMELRIERHVCVAHRIIQIQRIAHSGGVIPLLCELLLAELEGAGELDGSHDADNDGPGIGGQALEERTAELGEVEVLLRHERS